MKTELLALSLLTIFASGPAFAQSTGPDSSTVTTSTGPSVITSPGTETDRAPGAAAKATQSSSAVGILVKDGKAFLLRGGQLTAVDAPLSMTVSPDGSITGFDGQTTTLPDGQMLTMDGRITMIPNPVTAAIVPGLADQKVMDDKAKANEEMAAANSQSSINQPTSDSPVMENKTGTGSGGGGNTNKPRRATTGSSESGGSAPR